MRFNFRSVNIPREHNVLSKTACFAESVQSKGVRKNTESAEIPKRPPNRPENTETATESAREYQMCPKIQNSLRLIFKV